MRSFPDLERPSLSVHRRLAYVIETEFEQTLDSAEMDELHGLASDAVVDGGFAASLSLEEARAIVTACLPRLER